MRTRFLTEDINNIGFYLDATKTTLKVKYYFIDDNTKEEIEKEVILNLSELQSRRDWKSGSVISLMFNYLSKEYVGLDNIIANSYSSKRLTTFNSDGLLRPIHLILPFESADFSEIGVQVINQKNFRFTAIGDYAGNFIELPYSQTEKLKQVRDFIPKISIEGPAKLAANTASVYTVTAKSKNTFITKPLTVYLEVSAGYISKNKLTLINGKGTFTLRALDLEAGGNSEIKVGFRYLSNKANMIVEIT